MPTKSTWADIRRRACDTLPSVDDQWPHFLASWALFFDLIVRRSSILDAPHSPSSLRGSILFRFSLWSWYPTGGGNSGFYMHGHSSSPGYCSMEGNVLLWSGEISTRSYVSDSRQGSERGSRGEWAIQSMDGWSSDSLSFFFEKVSNNTMDTHLTSLP